MLPKDFSFAQLPKDKPLLTLKEVGLLGSSLEDVDSSMLDFLRNERKFDSVKELKIQLQNDRIKSLEVINGIYFDSK